MKAEMPWSLFLNAAEVKAPQLQRKALRQYYLNHGLKCITLMLGICFKEMSRHMQNIDIQRFHSVII